MSPRPTRPPTQCGHCGEHHPTPRVILDQQVCQKCALRFGRVTKPCPGCGVRKVLAFYDAARQPACAHCTGNHAIYACIDCGREDSPFGRRCAPCELARRLTDLLADNSGAVHPQLQPVFDALMAAPRPQSVHYWLTRRSSRPDLLRAMATGDMAISHEAFADLPHDRAIIYVRDLLAAVGVLAPYQASLERITPWLRDLLAALPKEHADLIDRFTRWQLLRRLRLLDHRDKLTRGSVQHARAAVLATTRLLAWLDTQQTSLADMTQTDLDRYLDANPGTVTMLTKFLDWANHNGISADLTLPKRGKPLPEVRLSDDDRWQHVQRLLNDDTIRRHVRIAGLFILLFAQPLSRVCRMKPEHVTLRDDGVVTVTFDTEPIELPEPLDRLLLTQLEQCSHHRYATHRDKWLFPGRQPGRALATENFRAELVAHGIPPAQARKAAMFQLAAEMPAPVLADLLGLSNVTASRWAGLAARDWSQYAAMRRHNP